MGEVKPLLWNIGIVEEWNNGIKNLDPLRKTQSKIMIYLAFFV
jgi:hypothetical protein